MFELKAPPFFQGTTIVAREADGMLCFTRPSPTPFDAPARTTALFLPRATLVDVQVTLLDERAAVVFLGSFEDVSRPPRVTLQYVSSHDASSLAETLKRRLGLPLVPVVCSAEDLGTPPPSEFVEAIGQYCEAAGHANFGAVRLAGALFLSLLQVPLEEGRYRVRGFYRPAHALASTGVTLAGYAGPHLMVVSMDPVGA